MPHTAHTGRAPRRLRDRSSHRRGNLADKRGKSCLARKVPTGRLPSMQRHPGRRNGAPGGARRGTPGSSSVGRGALPDRRPRRGRRTGCGGRPAPSVHLAVADGEEPTRSARAGRSTRRRQAIPCSNCAGSSSYGATKKPGWPCLPGSFGRIGLRAQSFLTASVSFGTASNRSATRK